jgi:cytochrome P450
MGTTSALLFDPTDPELRRDPYPTYRRMREEAPAWRSPEGVWYFTATRTASTCSEVRHSATTAPRRRRIRAACRRTPSSGPASWQRRAPETLDIARGVNRHLSFGVGHHLCIGSALARFEAVIALRRLFERLPALTLSADDEPEYRPNLQLRGFSKLPVSIA